MSFPNPAMIYLRNPCDHMFSGTCSGLILKAKNNIFLTAFGTRFRYGSGDR